MRFIFTDFKTSSKNINSLSTIYTVNIFLPQFILCLFTLFMVLFALRKLIESFLMANLSTFSLLLLESCFQSNVSGTVMLFYLLNYLIHLESTLEY